MFPSSRHTFDHYSKQAFGEPETYSPPPWMPLCLPEGSGVHAAATMLSYLAAAGEKWYINTVRRAGPQRPPPHTYHIRMERKKTTARPGGVRKRVNVAVQPSAPGTPRLLALNVDSKTLSTSFIDVFTPNLDAFKNHRTGSLRRRLLASHLSCWCFSSIKI